MKLTAVGDVITAVAAALDAAVAYPVFDGPMTTKPGRTEFTAVAIGAENPYVDEDRNPVNSADMSQVWRGLGQVARDEALHIPCCAVGKAATVAQARALALSAGQDVFDALRGLGRNPTPETYGALVSDVTSIDSRPTAGGAVVTVHFIISASARLT